MSPYPNMVSFVAQSFPQRFFRIQGYAVLIKIGFFQIFTNPHKTGIRLQAFGQQFYKRCFPRTIWSDNTDFIAFNNTNRKILYNFSFTERLGNMLSLNHHFRAKFRSFRFQINRAGHFYLFAAFLTQLLQAAQASHIATPASRHAFVQPFGFFGNFFI